ncbi:MAG: BNR-4 repeat-containing protein [Verrucomicrobiota bacterium]
MLIPVKNLLRRRIGFAALIATILRTAGGPVQGQTNFATLTTDGAWTWYNDHRAMFHNGKLYFGFVRAGDSKSTLSVFDLATGRTTNLWASGFTQLDDHNNPAILAKQDGRLLSAYSRHLSDQYFSYRTSISTNPVGPADWNVEQNIPNSGASMTYANLFQLSSEGGKIYNYCRNQNFNPSVFTSTDGGTNWSAAQIFIRTGTGSIRPYMKYASDNVGRIDFLYTDGHPRDVANSLYHLYYTNGAYYQTDGTYVRSAATLPLLHDSGERGTVIYQYSDAAQTDPNAWIPTGRAWCWETAYQSNGAPVCVFTVQCDNVAGPTSGPDDRIYYYYARWTGTTWQKRFIANAGRPLYAAEDDYAGGICLDPVEPNVIYISSNAQNPFDLADPTTVPLSASQRYELWRGVTGDGGLTFTWSQITSNSTVDNLRPYVPRRNGGERSVLWFRGNYASYTAYSCSIVGLFTSLVPTNAPASKITYLDATSGAGGNTALAVGGAFIPSTATSGTDGLWRLRTLGHNATTFESGGDISTTGNAAGGNNEDTARLTTTISGLTPGARYSVYAYFWNASGQTWRIRAGLTNSAGELSLYTSISEPTAVAGDFVTAPLLVELDRTLKQAYLGATLADAGGQIQVYVDDDPAARLGQASAWSYRTWYDGAGYALLPPTNPAATNLGFSQSGNSLNLSWPSGQGWRLQAQSNNFGVGTSNNWTYLTDGIASSTNIPLDPTQSAAFYRLAYP